MFKDTHEGQTHSYNDNCGDSSHNDEYIIPSDNSTTRISRPCMGCGTHPTIAGALLKSKYWKDWYKYATDNRLYDVDETQGLDMMSDEHFEDFIKFILQKQL